MSKRPLLALIISNLGKGWLPLCNVTMVHTLLVACNIRGCALWQVFGCSIPGTKGRYMYGTGIISVIGTSFTFLNVTQASIGNMMVSHAH